MYPQPDYPVSEEIAEVCDPEGHLLEEVSYTNLPNGCLFRGVFIPDVNVFKHEPEGDEDPAWPTWYFDMILQLDLSGLNTFQLDEGVTTQPPNPVTVTAGDWSSGDHIPPKVEPDFD